MFSCEVSFRVESIVKRTQSCISVLSHKQALSLRTTLLGFNYVETVKYSSPQLFTARVWRFKTNKTDQPFFPPFHRSRPPWSLDSLERNGQRLANSSSVKVNGRGHVFTTMFLREDSFTLIISPTRYTIILWIIYKKIIYNANFKIWLYTLSLWSKIWTRKPC